MSHELRTPLTSILGWSRLLQSNQLNEKEQERALQVIQRNAEAQSKLIEDLLDVSRIITGKLKIEVQPVSFASITEGVIAAEHLPHIFERFRQVDSSNVRAHGGLGLGLAIVDYLVRQQAGTVVAESEGPDKGATFVVEFPLTSMEVIGGNRVTGELLTDRPSTGLESAERSTDEKLKEPADSGCRRRPGHSGVVKTFLRLRSRPMLVWRIGGEPCWPVSKHTLPNPLDQVIC